MLKQVLVLLTFIALSTFVGAQSSVNFWTEVAERDLDIPANAQRQIIPQKYQLLELDLRSFKKASEKAPSLGENAALLVDIPMPDGNLETFELWEAPIMHPGLAAKFPFIKTYKVRNQNTASVGRLDYTLKGFHASILTPNGTVYIDPYASEQDQYYISYYTKDHVDDARHASFKCDLPHDEEIAFTDAMDRSMMIHEQELLSNPQKSAPTTQIRTYRLAVATTGEYASYHGGTKPQALSAVVTAMNRVNSVIELELGVHLELIENNDLLIFTDAATDGYSNGNTQAMIGENPNIINSIINVGDYDIGHVFCTDAGGLAALGSVCSDRKANGVTCHGNPIGDNFYVDYICHEMGHQFGGPHTFNNCDSDNENPPTAFEPGSGSTIMSYSGLCGINNLQFGSDPYYNIGALELMKFYMHEGFGNSCAAHTETANNEPVADIPIEDGFFIPIRTPFELKGSATDADGDAIYYCWEQYDTGPLSPVGSPIGNAPIIRSYPPTTNPNRIIPRVQNLISNSTPFGVDFPTYSREMNFRLVVRDNNMEAGGTHWDQVSFEATASAGPFRVTEPNSIGEERTVGEYTEIQWDVANSDSWPVNCKFVNIYLSTNNGNQFPTLLVANTPNDGKEFVTIPNTLSNNARIKVEAADNIFFDISNTNFKILEATQAGYGLTVSPLIQQVCLPSVTTIDLSTFPVLDYTDEITFEIISGLPDGAAATFSANPSNANDGSSLTLDLNNVTETGTFEILLQASAPNTDTTYRTIIINTVSNDFSALALESPANSASNVSILPELSWTMVADAESYTIEIATSPAFGDSIIDIGNNLTNNNYTLSVTLEESTLYYWRVRPSNICGDGTYTPTNVFNTQTFSCAATNSMDTPIFISTSGTPTIESKINVLTNGIINDVNIPIIRGNHERMNNISAKLISPIGTSVNLFSGCLGYNGEFDFKLDDEAPAPFSCPPYGSFIPSESLTAFAGENTFGLWTLQINDNQGGDGGALDAWQLEFCASISPTNPLAVTNIPMPVNTLSGRNLSNDFLFIDDENNEEWQLVHTLIEAPQNGTLYLNGQAIGVGDQYTQSDVRWGGLRYEHEANGTMDDFFLFAVNDDEGGWTGVLRFDIVIDDSEIVSTSTIGDDNSIRLFPNPNNGKVHLQFKEAVQNDIEINITNVEGKNLQTNHYQLNSNSLQLDASLLPQGFYILKIKIGNQLISKKMIIQ